MKVTESMASCLSTKDRDGAEQNLRSGTSNFTAGDYIRWGNDIDSIQIDVLLSPRRIDQSGIGIMRMLCTPMNLVIMNHRTFPSYNPSHSTPDLQSRTNFIQTK
jgi:hypothetical protein